MNYGKKILNCAIVLAVAVATLAPSPASADSEAVYFGLRPLGWEAGGTYTDAAIDGNMAVVSQGTGIAVYDLTRPFAEMKRGVLSGVTAEPTTCVDLHGSIAVVGTDSSKYFTVSIADPDHPQLLDVETLEEDEVNIIDVAYDGTTACITLDDGDPRFLDVSDPSDISVAFTVPAGSCYGVDVDNGRWILMGEFLYVAEGSAETTPRLIGAGPVSSNLPINSTKSRPTIVMGDRVISANKETLWIHDISIPSRPVQVASLKLPGDAWALQKLGPDLVVVTAGSGLSVVDISAPALPAIRAAWVQSTTFPLTVGATVVAPDGRIVCRAGGGRSLFEYTGPLSVSSTPTTGLMAR